LSEPRPTSSFEHAYEILVRYGDTDQMGIAYYANYLYWFEIARTEWLRSRGTSYREIESGGVVLPVIEAHCRYLRPARYDDRLRLVAWVGELTGATVRFVYRIELAPDQVLATGWTRHCFLGRDGRPVRITGELKDLLSA